MPSGVGPNWYITADEFMTNYWNAISVPGVLCEGNYVCVVEPPEGFDESVFNDDATVTIGELPGMLSMVQQMVLRDIQRKGLFAPELFKQVAGQLAINAATEAVNDVLVFSGRSLDGINLDVHLDMVGLRLLKSASYDYSLLHK